MNDEIAGVRDTLIVAANNPASHGGLEGLREIMRQQAARLAASHSTPVGLLFRAKAGDDGWHYVAAEDVNPNWAREHYEVRELFALQPARSDGAVAWQFVMVPTERAADKPLPERIAWTACTKAEHDEMLANPVAGEWRYHVRALSVVSPTPGGVPVGDGMFVPLTPTDAMIAAAQENDGTLIGEPQMTARRLARIYETMLAAVTP